MHVSHGKKEAKRKLSIYWLIFILILTYGLKLSAMIQRTKSLILAQKLVFSVDTEFGHPPYQEEPAEVD